jgi:serine protease Do
MKIVKIIATTLFLFIVNISSLKASVPLDSLAPMLKNVLPAIVNIKAQIKVTDFNTLREIIKQQQQSQQNQQNQAQNPLNQQSLGLFLSVGSGVIVNANAGYVLTNAHVVNDAQTITVTLSDGRHFTAKLIGLDRPSDIALLQIKAKNLTAIPLGNSNTLQVGDFVAAIGNPFGLNQTVTAGIISALGRTTLGIENFENFIQTDAPINPGNSGGALLNVKGELVGVNTAILAPERGSVGIGFAIPINMAKSVMEQLIEYGNVKRGTLGISAQDISPELANVFNLAEQKGALVTQVYPDSPAQQGGLQVGDIINSINGIDIKNANDVVNSIGFLRVDSQAKIGLLRDKKQITATVTLSDANKQKQMLKQQNPFLYGVGLKNFRLLSPIHGFVQGVLVVSVDTDSNPWQADLRPGDVIVSVNQHKVTTLDELKAEIGKANKEVLLNVLRGASAVFIVITKES